MIGDKGDAGREFAAAVAELGSTLLRPARKNESDPGAAAGRNPLFWTAKDLLTLERHGARTLPNLRARIAQRLLALTAGVYLNHWLGRPTRALVDFAA